MHGLRNLMSADIENTNELIAAIPFLHQLGAQIAHMGDGKAEITLTLSEDHMNSWLSAHGGVVMTLLDAAMSFAGRSLYKDARAGVTVDMTTSFLRSGGTIGDQVIVRGKANYQSTTLCFCEGELWCDGQLAAKSMATFKYLRSLDAARRASAHSVTDNT